MRVFSNPAGLGSLWFDNLATADGIPVAYDPQARAFVPMPPFCINRDIIGCIRRSCLARRKLAFVHDWLRRGAQGL